MSDVIGVRLPPELIEKIDKIAKREGNPRSSVIRRLIVEGLEKIKSEG